MIRCMKLFLCKKLLNKPELQPGECLTERSPLRLLEARAELSHLSPNFVIPSGPKNPQPLHPGLICCPGTCLISILTSVTMLLLWAWALRKHLGVRQNSPVSSWWNRMGLVSWLVPFGGCLRAWKLLRCFVLSPSHCYLFQLSQIALLRE